ncbi:MAG: hypothetical protein ACOH14_14265 [Rhodoglobus sp.]
MSTAARKARKRAGIPFTKVSKVGTPFQERAWFSELVTGFNGRQLAAVPRPRSAKKRLRALQERGFEVPFAEKAIARE